MSAALQQSWPPFVLIAGLLLIGRLANRDGLFAWGAAVFAARRRRVAVEPFLYGCVFMANASSLFLPGSNLTNLLVLDAHTGGSGASFAAKMFPLAITAAAVTAVGVGVGFRRHLAAVSGRATEVQSAARVGAGRAGGARGAGGGAGRAVRGHAVVAEPAARVTLGAGALATAAAMVLVLALHQPALAVLAVGLAAISTVFVNNLPAAALYSAHAVDHSRMLLLGLNVGPNLAATGALSALLWFRSAREVDARPSLLEFSRRGIPLALVAMAAAIVVGMLA